MSDIQALILGLVQGLTEYLPVSSSGHLEIGKMLLGIDSEAGGLTFDIIVHIATVFATLVVLWKEIGWIFRGLLKFEWNDETKYTMNILISMIPVGIVGFFFKDSIEALYTNEHIRALVVGSCLIITAILLTLTYFYQPREREKISPLHAFIIGIAQACAVLPGLSRSGSTIATGLLLGNSKQKLAQFSFLMVIPPILGEALLDFKHIFAPSAEYLAEHGTTTPISTSAIIIGFLAAFISGCFACKWMISLVKKCKLIYFGIYCAIIGVLVLILG
ncbi:MAG: undecaprenyl-diphosphate phosphatase [Bacteroidaceae bacterium]|jgi:undecaprenyl-diphosphatase|nr:undecaprenyl-diphosphate phosphatase [Bacteroidaceae bacterium]MBR3546305.1 undecaprenyl-diphosphate phosphatase [Bacteroidaceae bacterium]